MRLFGIMPLIWACTGENILEKQANSIPTIVITSHSDGAELQDGYIENFRAAVSDDDNEFLELSIAWYVGEELVCDWMETSPAGDSNCAVVFTEGDTHIVAEVRDLQGGAGRAEVAIIVLPTEAPVIELLTPVADEHYYSDQLIQFSAFVSDLEDDADDLIILWTSSVDGELSLNVAVDSDGGISDYTYLSEGNHALELRVEDASGKVSTEEVVIQVGGENDTPACSITDPITGTTAVTGAAIIFGGMATDDDIPNNQLQVEVSSNMDGVFQNLRPFSDGSFSFGYDGLSVGTHTVTLKVTDEIGSECSTGILLSVGTPPLATLEEPLDGAVYAVGETVTFRGTVSDSEDQSNQISVIWNSDIAGELYSGNANSQGISQFTRSDLSAGVHSVSFSATDTSGLVADELISFRVNTLPTVDSLSLSPSPVYSNSTLSASATSSDLDAQNITMTYAWLEDGILTSFTGTTITASELDVGETWTVRVTPNDGFQDGTYVEQSIAVSNSLPLVSNVSISPNISVYNDTVLSCSATASDSDQVISPTYLWDVNGSTYTGASLDLSTTTSLPNDNISCTATATDQEGATASAVASITIENRDPTIDTSSLSPSSPSAYDSLTCSATASDPDGGSPGLSFAFENLTTGAQYSTTSSTSSSAILDLSTVSVSTNDEIQCQIMVSDLNGGVNSTTEQVTVMNSVPTIDSITISPNTGVFTETSLSCTATASDLDDGNLSSSIGYAWRINGNLVSSQSTYTVLASQSYVWDTIVCTASVVDSDGQTASDTASVTLENTAPTVSGVLITGASGAYYNDEVLTCSATIDDIDESPTVSYVWSSAGVDIGYADNLDLGTTSLLPADSLTCTVNVSDSNGGAVSASSSVSIGNRAPSTPSIAITPSSPVEGQDDLTCTITSTSSDPDGQGVSYNYYWLDPAGQIQQSTMYATVLNDVFLASGTSAGTWTCEVEASDGIVASSVTTTVSVSSVSGPCITTWNPNDADPDINFLNNNMTVQTSASWGGVRATTSKSSGKWYYEAQLDGQQGFVMVGVGYSSFDLTQCCTGVNGSWGYYLRDAALWGYGGNLSNAAGWCGQPTCTIGVAVDVDSGEIWWSMEGVWQLTGNPSNSSGAFNNLNGTVYPQISIALNYTATSVTLQTCSSEMEFTPPSGFSTWD